MLGAIIRKAVQVMGDPVLQRWLVGRALGRFPAEPLFTAHRPPYLANALPLAPEMATALDFAPIDAASPDTSIDLPLPGLTITLNPGEESSLFARTFEDTEVLLATHRFAWLPLLEDRADPAWVEAIWNVWQARYGTPDNSWAWHPYTAAERAINILHYAQRYGLPGAPDQTARCLACHAPVIAERLEFFGDHHTSNHLANNGRGLFLLGLWLDMPKAADIGGRILIEEAKRIFRPSGMLREGSSHYHLLLARNYDETAREAEAHGRQEAPALRDVADRAKAAAAMLILPGGLPLIGDVSPDRPPINLLEDFTAPITMPPDSLIKDGWLRHDYGPWSGLWHLPPEGWRYMPGHGHEDAGGFEIHFGDMPLFIDPGRGSYGKSGDFDLSGKAHNTLLIDGQNPYPPNRPYYDDAFRHRICGDSPELSSADQGVRVIHQGFSRLGGVGAVSRHWQIEERSLTISDSVKGSGSHAVTRFLVTPLATEISGDAVILRSDGNGFRITAPGSRFTLNPITRWTAYGVGETITQIGFAAQASLPWFGKIIVEKI